MAQPPPLRRGAASCSGSFSVTGGQRLIGASLSGCRLQRRGDRVGRSQEIGYPKRRDQDRGHPEQIVVGKQRQQRQDAHHLQLGIVAFMSHSFRHGVQTKIQNTDQQNHRNREHGHEGEKKITVVCRRDVGRQMGRGHWIDFGACHWRCSFSTMVTLRYGTCGFPRQCGFDRAGQPEHRGVGYSAINVIRLM